MTVRAPAWSFEDAATSAERARAAAPRMADTKRAATRKSTAGAAPTDKDMLKAEREVGENIPDEMVGLDSEDVGDVDSRH